jgi:hypothetical protein
VSSFFHEKLKLLEISGPNAEQEQSRHAEEQHPDFSKNFAALRHITKSLFGHLGPAVELAKWLSEVGPELLQSIYGLEKITECYLPMIRELEDFKMRYERRSIIVDDVLQFSEKMLQLVHTMHLAGQPGLKDFMRTYYKQCNSVMEILILKNNKHPTIYDTEIFEDSPIEPSDNLSLPQDDVIFDQDKHRFVGEGPSSPCIDEKLNEANANENIDTPTDPVDPLVPDAWSCNSKETMEGLEEKLKNVTKERDEARIELQFLKSNLIKDLRPREEHAMSWLAYVHKLMDVDDMVNAEIKNLVKRAAVVPTGEDDVNGTTLDFVALETHRKIFNRRLDGLTEFTQWGDIDQMMHRTNHFQNDKSGNVDWAQEIEESWMPYNVFSSHLLDEEKHVVHTCDPAPDFLKEKCCLCQNGFGPEH